LNKAISLQMLQDKHNRHSKYLYSCGRQYDKC